MAHSLSAKKRIRQNTKARALNRWRKRRVHQAVKQYHETILHGSADDAQNQLTGIYKILDQTAAKGTIHKNAAARYKARLTRRLNDKRATASA